jgi:hypothetical protein
MMMNVLRMLLNIPQSPGHVSASLHRQRDVLGDIQRRMTRTQWLRTFRMQLEDVQALFRLVADDLHTNVATSLG